MTGKTISYFGKIDSIFGDTNHIYASILDGEQNTKKMRTNLKYLKKNGIPNPCEGMYFKYNSIIRNPEEFSVFEKIQKQDLTKEEIELLDKNYK